MKAIQYSKTGGPENLELKELPLPHRGDGEVGLHKSLQLVSKPVQPPALQAANPQFMTCTKLQCMCALQVLIKQYSTSVNPVEVKMLAAESTKLPKVWFTVGVSEK